MMPKLPKATGYVKDVSLLALRRDEATVMMYPAEYLIRPSVSMYTEEQMLDYGHAVAEACAQLVELEYAPDEKALRRLHQIAAHIRAMVSASPGR